MSSSNIKPAEYYLDDPEFPTLARALNTIRMIRYFESMIIDKLLWRIVDCNIVRLRYRKQQRCIVHYEVILENGIGDRHTIWLMGYFYAKKDKIRYRHRYLQSIVDPNLVTYLMESYAIFQDIDMLVICFPYDRKLPALLEISKDYSKFIESHCASWYSSDNWWIMRITSDPVRWRSGLSAVIRLRLLLINKTTNQVSEDTLYVKAYNVNNDFEEESDVDNIISTIKLPFNVVKQLYHCKNTGVVISASAPGISLITLLNQGRLLINEAVLLANTLARWHLYDKSLQRKILFADIDGERIINILSTAAPSLAHRINILWETIQRQWRQGILCPSHMDLKPEHIFYYNGSITLIDLESAANADPTHDIARLLSRIIFSEEMYGAPIYQARTFAAVLLSSYLSRVPPNFLDNLPYAYAISLLQCAVSIFESHSLGWPGNVAKLVREAERVIREGWSAFDWISRIDYKNNMQSLSGLDEINTNKEGYSI